ncbi:ADP-ribosylglycohydrolase family protein, partial [Singulisphaera rosea]
MPQLSRLDRVRGSLLGLATGDALGAPLEGLSAQQIRAHYGVVADYVDGSRAWKKKPYRWRMPGLYSDDTQQALALSDVLLDLGEIDADRLASLYLQMAHPRGSHYGAHRGIGRSFRQVLGALEEGTSPLETGQAS